MDLLELRETSCFLDGCYRLKRPNVILNDFTADCLAETADSRRFRVKPLT
jgi:hypothetical protein